MLLYLYTYCCWSGVICDAVFRDDPNPIMRRKSFHLRTCCRLDTTRKVLRVQVDLVFQKEVNYTTCNFSQDSGICGCCVIYMWDEYVQVVSSEHIHSNNTLWPRISFETAPALSLAVTISMGQIPSAFSNMKRGLPQRQGSTSSASSLRTLSNEWGSTHSMVDSKHQYTRFFVPLSRGFTSPY